MGSDAEDDVVEMLTSPVPVPMMEASKRVARFLVLQFAEWSAQYQESNKICEATAGQSITPADPIFGGLLLAFIHLLMEPGNQRAIDAVGDHLTIPQECRGGVRAKVNELLNQMGLADQTHILNWVKE